MALPQNYGTARRNLYGGYTFYNYGMRTYGSSRQGLGGRFNYYDNQYRFRGYDRNSNGRFYSPRGN